MIKYTTGNLLEDGAEALVNTVNTVGIMGKGVALMFKEAFKENFKEYARACEKDEVRVGRMFVTRREQLWGPKWIINFPTKKHWRTNTQVEWIEEGLSDLIRVIEENDIKSIAIPPLGSGNGGLDWLVVRPKIADALERLENVEITIYEPTNQYQNVAKREGVEELTPARALIAEMVRRYWVLGIECSLLEIQKLAWFLERKLVEQCEENPLNLQFTANRYGPYAKRLDHLLDALDGSYLHCDKRIADATPYDVIAFDDCKKDTVGAYLNSGEAKKFAAALEAANDLVDGFQSPFGLELLSTVDWLIHRQGVEPELEKIRDGIRNWPGGKGAGDRKLRIFDDRMIGLALARLDGSI